MTTSHVHGFTTKVTLDASSTAVVEHGVGKVPTAVVVQSARPGQLATVLPSSYTDTNFRVKMNWHDGVTFKPGTIIELAVFVVYEEDEEPPAEPPSARCTQPVFVTEVPRGDGSNWSDPAQPNVVVNNEVWNADEAGPQKLSVCSARSWFVESTQPKAGADPSSIKSYPCTQTLFSNPTLGSLIGADRELSAKWAHEAPATGEWNWAFDIWHNGWSSPKKKELMIWTEHRYGGDNLAPLPPGNAIDKATATIDGKEFVAWRRDLQAAGDRGYIALVAKTAIRAGQLDLKQVYAWLISKGWMTATETLTALNYGVEIADTKQKPERFYLNDYVLTVR